MKKPKFITKIKKQTLSKTKARIKYESSFMKEQNMLLEELGYNLRGFDISVQKKNSYLD